MVRAAVGFWLTGLAAAGAALGAVSASGAGPAHADRLAAVKCDAGNGVGLADRRTYDLEVNGQSLRHAVLKAGDELSTDPSGSVDICLRQGRTACRIRGNAVVRVLPQKGHLLQIFRSAEGVTCETTTGEPVKVKTPQATIIIDKPHRRTSATDPAAKLWGTTAVYEIGVATKRTVLAVGSGRVLIAKGDSVKNARVVRPSYEAVVREGAAKPNRPKVVVRRLWGSGQGRFRTRGRYSHATLKG